MSSRFFYMSRKSRQKFKYLEDEKSFQDEIIFVIFEGLSCQHYQQKKVV